MGGIIFQIVVIVALVLLLAFVAYDDRRTTRLRAEEERVAARDQDRESQQ